MEDNSFPTCAGFFPLLLINHVPKAPNNCSFNTAASSTFFFEDSFTEAQTFILRFAPVFSGEIKNVLSRSFLIDVVLNWETTFWVKTHSPNCLSFQDCRCSQRNNIMDQQRATTQHILNKRLPTELKKELRLNKRQHLDSSGLLKLATQSPAQTAAGASPTPEVSIYGHQRNKKFVKLLASS